MWTGSRADADRVSSAEFRADVDRVSGRCGPDLGQMWTGSRADVNEPVARNEFHSRTLELCRLTQTRTGHGALQRTWCIDMV